MSSTYIYATFSESLSFAPYRSEHTPILSPVVSSRYTMIYWQSVMHSYSWFKVLKLIKAVQVTRMGHIFMLFEVAALARNFHFLFSSAALNSLRCSQAEICCDITQQETSLQKGRPSAPVNWTEIKKTNTEGGGSFYSSATSKWHTRPLRPESIFVVMMETPQFPLFNKVLLVCVPLPAVIILCLYLCITGE